MQIPCLREGHILFCREKHYVSDKKFSETYFISMLETTYLVCLVDLYSQTIGIPMVPTVLSLLTTRSFVRTKQTSYSFWKK